MQNVALILLIYRIIGNTAISAEKTFKDLDKFIIYIARGAESLLKNPTIIIAMIVFIENEHSGGKRVLKNNFFAKY